MNITELITEIESRFHCMTGPPVAYFELPTDLYIARFTYSTIRFVTMGTDYKSIDKLCLAFLKELPAKTEDRRCLFWRKFPSFEARIYSKDLDPETGVILVSNPRKTTSIRARLVIPGVTLNHITEGSESPWV